MHSLIALKVMHEAIPVVFDDLLEEYGDGVADSVDGENGGKR